MTRDLSIRLMHDNGEDAGPAPSSRAVATVPWTKELISKIAMDIGKEAVHHLQIMYPAAIAACPSTMKLSLRNHIHNQIMAAVEVNDEGEIVARIRERKNRRRKVNAIYKKIRGAPEAQ